MSGNIINLLHRSQVDGVGLLVVGEHIWENEINDISVVVRVRIPGVKEAVIPLLTTEEVNALAAGKVQTLLENYVSLVFMYLFSVLFLYVLGFLVIMIP